jgi:hypothetical protein
MQFVHQKRYNAAHFFTLYVRINFRLKLLPKHIQIPIHSSASNYRLWKRPINLAK